LAAGELSSGGPVAAPPAGLGKGRAAAAVPPRAAAPSVDSGFPAWLWLYAAGWLAYLSIYAAALAVRELPLALAVRVAIANLLPEGVLGLLLLRVPRHVPWRPAAGYRFFLTHAGLLVAWIAGCTAGWLLLWSVDGRLFEGAWQLRFSASAVPWRLLTELLLYSSLVGLGYTLQNAATSRDLAARAARADALRARAEVAALRSQLQPHFVLNTLHALVGLVRRDPALAEHALERLGDVLRHGLRVHREGIDLVPLAAELVVVRAYLDLEGLRLGDRLTVDLEVDPGALDDELPSFALQTLVENAVQHGIAPRPEGGRVEVRARRHGAALHVDVANDVPGAAAAESPGRELPGGEGLGLRLLQERLDALYPAGAALACTLSGGRFHAALTVPLRADDDA
jgi:hypothetical protein